MKNKSSLQDELNKMEDKIWRKNVTTEDKLKYGSLVGGVILLLSALSVVVVPITMVIIILPGALLPGALGTIAQVVFSPALVALCAAEWNLAKSLTGKSMNWAINKVKKRCSDEINVKAIEKLSEELEKEIVSLKGVKGLQNDGIINEDISKEVVGNIEELKRSIRERSGKLSYNKLEKQIEEMEKSVIQAISNGAKDEDISKAVNVVSNLKDDVRNIIDAQAKAQQGWKYNIDSNSTNKNGEKEKKGSEVIFGNTNNGNEDKNKSVEAKKQDKNGVNNGTSSIPKEVESSNKNKDSLNKDSVQ